MKNLEIAIAVLGLAWTTAGCAPMTTAVTPQVYYPEESFRDYTERTDKVTLSAGDDQEVNTRIQEIDPWPRYVGNRKIPTSGERMAGAVERYRTGKQINAQPPLPLVGTQQNSSGGGSSTGGK
jgi:hypothetical protein